MPLTAEVVSGVLNGIIDEAVMSIVQEINSVQIQVDKYIAAQNGQLSIRGLQQAIFGGGSSVVSAELSSFQKYIFKTIIGAANDSWGKGTTVRQAESGRKTALYTWRTESKRPCPDCATREGDTRTLAEWQAVGLPRSGFSICGRNCKCIVDSKGTGAFDRTTSQGEL